MTDQWVITGRTVTQDGLITTIEITTDKAVILRICTLSTQPARVPITRIRRGAPVICGYQLHYASPVCYDQEQPGPTTDHTWSIPTPDSLTETWAVVTEPPEPSYGLQTSVPWVLTPDVIVPTLPYLILQLTTVTPFIGSAATPVSWDSILASRDWPWSPSIYGDITTPLAGVITASLTLPFDPGHNLLVTCAIQGNAGPTSLFGAASAGNDIYNPTANGAWTLHVPAGLDLRSLAQVPQGGPGTIRPGLTHDAQVALHYLSFD